MPYGSTAVVSDGPPCGPSTLPPFLPPVYLASGTTTILLTNSSIMTTSFNKLASPHIVASRCLGFMGPKPIQGAKSTMASSEGILYPPYQGGFWASLRRPNSPTNTIQTALRPPKYKLKITKSKSNTRLSSPSPPLASLTLAQRS